MAENSEETLDIYIAYDRLKAADLARFLSNFSFIADRIAQDFFIRFDDYKDEALPTLDISSIHTGESVKFSLKEGWLPKITTNDEGDIVVELPKKLGIPIVIGHLVVITAFGYQEYKNKQLDNAIKDAELQLKKIELAKALNPGPEKMDTSVVILNYVEQKVPEIKPVLMDTVKTVLGNADIRSFRVNGVEIKSGENGREAGENRN